MNDLRPREGGRARQSVPKTKGWLAAGLASKEAVVSTGERRATASETESCKAVRATLFQKAFWQICWIRMARPMRALAGDRGEGQAKSP